MQSVNLKEEKTMDKNFKAVNDAMVDYTISATKQIVELNTKLFNDYVELNRTVVAMFPGLEAWVPAYAKR